MSELGDVMAKYMDIAVRGDADAVREPYAGVSTQVDRYHSVSVFPHHEVHVDEPRGFGGADVAANPAELLLAAVAASIEVTIRAWAEYLHIPCTGIVTKMSGELDLRGFMDTAPGVRSGFRQLSFDVQLAGDLTADQRATLESLVRRCCPMLDTVRHGSPVELNVVIRPGGTT